MLINLKVKTLDARTHDFSIDNELTIRQFKDQIAVKTNIAAENQRIIYQGRVLADDKQVKEYDVDGKVLHVAERPPFSQRGANATNNDEPMRGFRSMAGRPTPRNMRNSPYFRALDGMLVGTMAIPVNNGNLTAAGTRTPPNRFPNSSSFCINRITVAQHMIDCANNIAAYLENPEIGLNNQPLDILQRGHWTMESTVVEVGVSSTDMPRNNNIIDMVQDAVTAALSRNTPGRNYTVVQLPTVYTNEGSGGGGGGGENTQQQQSQQQQQQSRDEEGASGEAASASDSAGNSESSEETTAAAAVIIEDVIVTDEDERSASPPSTEDATAAAGVAAGAEAEAGAGAAAGAAAAGEDPNGANVTGVDSRRRTRPQVLASVIQRYRTVESRLATFVDRYQEILLQDPEFGEQNNVERDNAQRTFDRVSEALHYLSHAQHAISDLMLDLSQPGPRVLTCRPILVEQSGYIRSNNIFTPNLVAAPLSDLLLPTTEAAASAAATGHAPAPIPATGSNPLPASAPTAAGGAQPEQLTLHQLLESFESDRWMRGAAGATAQPQFQLPSPTYGPQGAVAGAQRGQPPFEPTSPPYGPGTAVPAATATGAIPAPVGTRPGREASSSDSMEEDEERQLLLADAAAALVAGLGQRTDNVEDPVDEPMVAPPSAANAAGTLPQQQQTPRPEMNEHVEQSVESADEAPARPRFRLYMPVPLPPPNPHMRMARLIQAVVNSATNDADLRLEFNMPNVINLPVHVITAALHPRAAGAPVVANEGAATGTQIAAAVAAAAAAAAATATAVSEPNAATATAATAATTLGASGAASTSSGTRSGEQRANTLPTTATQTRSTARPQIQIGGNNNWAGRIAPTHTAFDRFLPCNSHHIREQEPLIQQTNNNNNISSIGIGTGSGNSIRRGAYNNAASSRATNVIASRLPRSHSYANLSRPMSARRENRIGGLPMGMASVGAAGSSNSSRSSSGAVSRAAQQPPMRRLSRFISASFEDFLLTTLRNHAQTGLVGTGTGTANVATTTTTTTNTAPPGIGVVSNAAVTANAADGPAAGSGAGAGAIAASVSGSNTSLATTSSAAGGGAGAGAQAARNLRAQVRSFVHQTVFEGGPINEQTIPTAIDRALDWFADCLLFLRQYERPEYNSHDSVCNMLRRSLLLVISLCVEPIHCHIRFEHRLKLICEQFRTRLYSVLFLCLGSDNAELFWRQLMQVLGVPLRSNFRNEALQFLCIYIDPRIPAQTDTADAEQFLVLRNAAQSTLPTDDDQLEQQQQQEHQQQQQQAAPEQQSLDNDIEMAEVASSSNSATEMEPPLPAVTPGSEPWHNSFPNDWLPVITRDLQTQTEQNQAQPPYSDAYISGMSAKRRKIIQTEKPPTNVECLIASGVQRAIHRTGLSNSSGGGNATNPAINPDVIINAIAHDAVVQASYTDAVRTNVRDRIKHDIDYKSGKYPQITKFTEQK
ncbi:GH14892 [Drosophila grimshawi]|uniref:BCL2-associated athanogene 6 n=1 Tax=Drosophila grimshawi TaxID=7222 RepID=B4J283_DROGR|nr:GH14892 [Drosophila grimshawi]